MRKISTVNNDFIYAAELFDYLSTPFATALTTIMFESINPGGRLLFANFLPNIRDCGFMKAIMGWWLIYRTENDLQFRQLPVSQIGPIQCYSDPDEQIVFLEVCKS
jgi:extracellular factor (EF) 3-hydroxypalmitic acid methyl ester biosynthesis protein